MSLFNGLARIKGVLHKGGSMILPVLLLVAGGALWLYTHATYDEPVHDDHPMRTFLAMIIIQMTPLIFLEFTLLKHKDPVALFGKFGFKVTSMHACFLLVRTVCCALHPRSGLAGSVWWNIALLGFAIFTLVRAFQIRSLHWHTITEVALLFAAGIVVAFTKEYWGARSYALSVCGKRLSPKCRERAWKSYHFQESFIDTASNFTELLAFVPACLAMVNDLYVEEASSSPEASASTHHQQREVKYFFAFLVGLYSVEDVIQAVHNYDGMPAFLGHLLHYLLVLDFSVYFLGEICDSEKLKAELAEWMPGVFHCSV